MVYVINAAKRMAVLEHLARQRARGAALIVTGKRKRASGPKTGQRLDFLFCCISIRLARRLRARLAARGADACPHLSRQCLRVGADAVTREVLAQARHVAFEQRKCTGMDGRIDGLREVDDPVVAAPVEHVERRQVGVHPATGEHPLHIRHQAIEQPGGLFASQLYALQRGRRPHRFSRVFHQDRVVREGHGLRNAHASGME